MRAHLALVSAALVLTVAVSADARSSTTTDSHLRPAEPSANALVADALDRSAVIRDLAAQLDRTDVVAYVRVVPHVDGGRPSSIHFLGRSPYTRYMVILVDEALTPDRQVALVGHELQHAVDMAGADWITDSVRMAQYFSLCGWRLSDPDQGFETLSALRTERKVGQELATVAAVASNRSRPR